MAEHKPPHQQAALQHLAHLQQDLVQRRGDSVLQRQQAVSEAALEAYLQQQAALVAVQALERERLNQQ